MRCVGFDTNFVKYYTSIVSAVDRDAARKLIVDKELSRVTRGSMSIVEMGVANADMLSGIYCYKFV